MCRCTDERGTGLCGWYASVHSAVRRHLSRDGDADEDLRRKVTIAQFLSVGVLCSLSLIPFLPVSALASTACLGVLLLWVAVRREAGDAFLRVTVATVCLMNFYYDVHAAMQGYSRMWAIYVLLYDTLIVAEAPRYLGAAAVVFAVVHFFLIETERATRALGLFDLPESEPYAARRTEWECDKPPCAHHNVVHAARWVLLPAGMLLLDYLFTRRFADQALKEKERMAAAVRAAKDVAQSLAGFDLATAGVCLENAGGDLPEELRASLHRLLGNLSSYRPYLPQSMLVADAGGAAADRPASQADDAAGGPATRRGSIPHAAENRLALKHIAAVHLRLDVPDVMSGGEACAAFAALHTPFLAAVLDAASAHRGIVDSFVGATVAVTFNATRGAVAPASKALGMIRQLHRDGSLEACTGAVAAAPAVVGFLGTAELRQPAVLGEAPELAGRLAAYAVAAAMRFVCNAGQYKETQLEQPMRVVMDHVVFEDGVEGDAAAAEGGRQVVVYEIRLDAAAQSSRGRRESEWMYQLEASGAEEFGSFNLAGRRRLLGQTAAAVPPRILAQVAAAAAAGRRWDFSPRVKGYPATVCGL